MQLLNKIKKKKIHCDTNIYEQDRKTAGQCSLIYMQNAPSVVIICRWIQRKVICVPVVI